MSGIKEVWKLALDGRYEVSNRGRIKGNIKRKGTRVGRYLRGSIQTRGYLRITCNELRKCFYIHRLVAEAFLGSCPEGKEVNHKNGNKLDNNIENLEYITHAENNKHAAGLGLFPQGEEHHAARLTTADVKRIRRLSAQGKMSQVEIAKQFGVQQMQVSRIVRRTRWQHVK